MVGVLVGFLLAVAIERALNRLIIRYKKSNRGDKNEKI